MGGHRTEFRATESSVGRPSYPPALGPSCHRVATPRFPLSAFRLSGGACVTLRFLRPPRHFGTQLGLLRHAFYGQRSPQRRPSVAPVGASIRNAWPRSRVVAQCRPIAPTPKPNGRVKSGAGATLAIEFHVLPGTGVLPRGLREGQGTRGVISAQTVFARCRQAPAA